MISKWHSRAHELWATFSNSKNRFLFLFGFASGLPLALTGNGATFQAWLTNDGVDITTIGWLSWCAIPYTVKFLWAPLIDRFVPPFLGRRRGWMLLTQTCLAVTVIGMGMTMPESQLPLIAFLAFMIALLSATQDIAVDAYRTDLLTTSERGMGVSAAVFGYRIAMLTSGALSLVIADYLGWRPTFILLGLLFVPSIAGLFAAPEPKGEGRPKNYKEAVIDPLKALFSRKGFHLMLALIIFYKLGDAFAESLITPFLLGLGFSKTDIGSINKVLGLGALLFGVFLGGILMSRITLYRALLTFGILQALSNLCFWVLALVGKSYAVFVGAIIIEKMTSGLGTTAFMAFLMSLCDKRYSATQYALLSAFAAFGRVLLGPLAGNAVENFGWATFYLMTVLVAIPGILFVVALKKPLLAHEAAEKQRNAKEQTA